MSEKSKELEDAPPPSEKKDTPPTIKRKPQNRGSNGFNNPNGAKPHWTTFSRSLSPKRF